MKLPRAIHVSGFSSSILANRTLKEVNRGAKNVPEASSDVCENKEYEREVDESFEGSTNPHDLVKMLRQFVAFFNYLKCARQSKSTHQMIDVVHFAVTRLTARALPACRSLVDALFVPSDCSCQR